MLIDDVTIKVQAGKGGKGGVYFNSNLMSLGPTGGRGGNGGNVYVEGVSDLGALRQFRYKKEIIAEDGENGKKKLNDGTAGEDIVLKVSGGTVLHNLDVKKDKENTKKGEKSFDCHWRVRRARQLSFPFGEKHQPAPIPARFAGRGFHYAHGVEAYRRCRSDRLPQCGEIQLAQRTYRRQKQGGQLSFHHTGA